MRLSLLVLLLFSIQAYASPSSYPISYSGRLINSSGQPLTGPLPITVEFFSTDTSTPAIWTHLYTGVSLADGIFQLTLDLTPTEVYTVFGSGSGAPWIRVTANGTSYPRQTFTAMPYALRVPVDNNSVIYDGSGQLTVKVGGASLPSATPSAGQSLLYTGSSWAFGNIGMGNVGVGNVGLGAVSSVAGKKGDVTLSTNDVAEGGNVYFTPTRARTVLSANVPLSYDFSQGIFGINQASFGANGYLTSSDWNSFNGKQASLSAATSVANGYLTSSDWIAFNGKEGAISAGTSVQYYRGDKSWQTLNTSAVTEGSNIYYSDTRARSAITASAPLVYSSASGIVSLPKATGSADGYLSSGDWSTFNSEASQWGVSGGNIYRSSGNVGIGTTAPVARLAIAGGDANSIFSNPTIALGYSSTGLYPHFIHTRHNTSGVGSAIDFYTSDGTAAGVYPINAVHAMSLVNGYVGIGTTAPDSALDVNGQIRIQGGTPGVNKVLTSDANGLASWTTPAVGGATSIATGTGLTGGPITSVGTLSLTTSGVTAGSYTRANVSVDSYGRLFSAANGTASNLGTSDVSGILAVVNGGTGGSSYSANTVILGGTTFSSAAGTADQVLRMSSGGIPGFGSIDLTKSATVAGALPVANGGSGASTLTSNAVLIGNGTSALQSVAPGTSNNVLISNGTSWTSAELTTSAVGEGSNLYYTDTRARAAHSVTGGALTYSSITGVFGLASAGSTAHGYISSSDWVTFNAASSQWTTSGGNIYRSTGYTGIGTTNPSAKLQVNIFESSTSPGATANQIGLSIYNTDATANNWSMISFMSNSTLASAEIGVQTTDHANHYGDFVVANRGTTGWGERMRVASSGNVGIGTTSPGANLQVGSSGDGSAALANAWNTFSDARLKRDLVVIPDALDKLLALHGYYYFWKAGSDQTRQVGVIAQEVESVLPELVHTGSDGIKTVDYPKLTALLIEAAKQLKSKEQVIEAENKDIKAFLCDKFPEARLCH